jgi:hypothetical protein
VQNKGSALVKFINQRGIPYLSIVHIMASGNFIGVTSVVEFERAEMI